MNRSQTRKSLASPSKNRTKRNIDLSCTIDHDLISDTLVETLSGWHSSLGILSLSLSGSNTITLDKYSTHRKVQRRGREREERERRIARGGKEETRPKRGTLFILVSATGNDGNDVAYYEPIVWDTMINANRAVWRAAEWRRGIMAPARTTEDRQGRLRPRDDFKPPLNAAILSLLFADLTSSSSPPFFTSFVLLLVGAACLLSFFV